MTWIGPLGVIVGGLATSVVGLLKSLRAGKPEDLDAAVMMVFLGLLVLLLGGIMAIAATK